MNSRSLLKIGTSLLLLSFLLIGISYSMLRAYGYNRAPNAGGRVLTGEVRKLDGEVTSVDLNGPIDLTLTQGPVASLK
ncbi:MAG: hypothetical protein ACEQSK_13820, partial [Sphingomonadaceae bacterium]